MEYKEISLNNVVSYAKILTIFYRCPECGVILDKLDCGKSHSVNCSWKEIAERVEEVDAWEF